MEEQPTERRISGRLAPKENWTVCVVVLALGWLLLYATRTALSSALKDIGDFWGLSEGYLGILSSSFFVSYTLIQVPSGLLADRFGPRKLILAGFGIQAAGLLLGVLAQNPFQFLLARILTGAGQSSYFACQNAILSFILPPNRRAGGVAFTTAGAGIGSALGFLLGRFLSAFSLGWKMPFVVLGCVSVVFIFLVLAMVPEPAIRRKPGAGAQVAPTGNVRPNWGFLGFMSLAHFLTMYGFYLMLTWLPYYLETARGFGERLAAVVPVVMPLIMTPATILWGNAADRSKSREFVLRITLPVAALATAALPAMSTPAALAAILALYGTSGKLVIDPILVSTVSEAAPPASRASVLAAFNATGSVAMILAPTLTGFIAEWTGSFDVSFYAAGGFHLVALFSSILGMRLLATAERS